MQAVRSNRGRYTLIVNAALFAVVPMAATVALAVPAAMQSAATPAALDPAVVDQIAQALRVEIAKLPAEASVEDNEATMTFALSQGDYTQEAMEGGLDIIDNDPGTSSVQHQAIANVRVALRRFRRGTSALLQGGGFGSGGGVGFSGPIIGIGGGGGGSNYGS